MIEIFKYVSTLLYAKAINFSIREGVAANILLGIGTGITANVMFVLTTEKEINYYNLTISFVLAIIILTIGSLERKGR